MGTEAELTLPAGFWSRLDVTSALDRRGIGMLLTLILDESGLSQHKFGALTGHSQTQINRWVHHACNPTLDSIREIADACGMPASGRARLGLSASAGTGPEDRPSEIRLHRILALCEYLGRTGDASKLGTWRDLAGPGSGTEEWERLEQGVLAQSPGRTTASDSMSYRTRGFYMVTAKLPARLVTRALTAHARDIALLLDAVENPGQRRQLTVAGGESAYLAACCNVDLGDFCGALRQLDTVEAAAKLARDGPLAAIALDGRSHFLAAQRHHARALELIRQARGLCPPDQSPGTLAYLWLRDAEEHVYLRRVGKAAAAWQRAEAHYARTDIATDRNWAGMWLSRDCWESVRAIVCSATGRREEAAESAERVAVRLAGSDGKTDAIALVNAALAQANVMLYRRAAVTGIDALHAVRAAEASACLGRLAIVADILAARPPSVPQVQAFLRDFTQTQEAFEADQAGRR